MWRTILLGTLLVGTANAEDPFACVDPDVATAFVGSLYGGEAIFSTELPDNFPTLNMPPDLDLVGSQSANTHTTVVYKTEEPAREVVKAVVSAMRDVGWSEEDSHHFGGGGGFQAASKPSFAIICNNKARAALTVMAAERGNRSFVSLVSYPQKHGCETPRNLAGTMDPRAIRAYIPTMNMPGDAEVTNIGSGGNGYEMSSRADVSSSLSRAELASFFDDQIREQGWEPQTTWSSSHSSGSVWARETEEFGLLIGTLHLIESETGPVRVRFDVAPAAASGMDSNSNWSLVSG